LFFFLLCHREGRRREELLEILWPELSPSLSRNAFYNNVYRARKALFKECLIQEGGVYKINPKGSLRFDLEEFRAFIEQADRLPRRDMGRVDLLAKAVHLYDGSFLKEFYSEWAETIRIDTEIQYLRALSQLAGLHMAQRNFAEAAGFLEKAISYDRTDVGAHEELIKLCFLAGDRAEAIRRYRFYSDVSQRELGVKPPKSLEQLRMEAASRT
jgi:two-component SAPR family response regulator